MPEENPILNEDTGGILENTVYKHYQGEYYFIRCVATDLETEKKIIILNKVFTTPIISEPDRKVAFGSGYSKNDYAIDYDSFVGTISSPEPPFSTKRFTEVSLEEMNDVANIHKVKYPLFLKFRHSFINEEEENTEED
jgi:hypothetical protein